MSNITDIVSRILRDPRRSKKAMTARGDKLGEMATAAFGGTISPRQLLVDALTAVDGAEMAVLVWIDKDEHIQTAWSNADLTKRLGMLEVAKLRMIDVAQED